MTLTRKLALALCLAFSFITLSSNSQVDPSTGNLINYGTTPTDTTSTWNNGVYVNQLCFGAGQPGNCGPNPSVRPGGNINFSYGTADLNQIVNINRALAAGGTGVQLSGFNFGFTAKNGNGWDDARQDYLAAYVKLYNAGGGLAANYDYSSQTNQRYNWTNFNFSETFANPVAASQYSNAQVGFVGRDNNFWAGNYGPEIYNVSFSLKYRVDPCATNVAYSPSCAGFNTVTTGGNVFNSSVWANAVTQSVAINTALKNGGIGATVHGINYGFDYTVGQSWFGCTATNQDGSCSWYMNVPAQVSATARLTASDSSTIFSKNHTLTGDGTSGSVSGQYLLPASLNQTGVGRFSLTGNASGTGSSIGNFSASLIYTADPCASNPLYNSTCTGYAVAYAKNMLLGSTVASASAPAVAAPAQAQSAPAEAAPALAQASPQQSQQPAQQSSQPAGPAPDANQNPSVAQDNPAQPSPQQAGPAPTSPQPAGGPPQTATASAPASSSGPQQGGPSGGGGGPSKLAMSVVKTAQANDKATQTAAVQAAAKTLEGSQQSSQASSNLAISMNQDMSANSAVAAATFASQTTQASTQVATQTSQSQQTSQSSSTQTSQASKAGPQTQQQQQDSQQAQIQSAGLVQAQAPQQQDSQQAQIQTSTSVVKLLSPPQEDSQQAQTQSTSVAQYQPPKQQDSQQAQTQTSTSVVKLLSPQQQEPQQTSSQLAAGAMSTPQPVYTAPAQQQQDAQSSQLAILKPPAPMVVEMQQTNTGTGITVSRNLFAYNPLMASNTSNMSAPLPASQPVYQPRLDTRQGEVEAPQYQISSYTGGRAGNPLSEIMMQQRFEMMQDNIAQPASSVNRNALPNELAGGVDIASIANVPAGFVAYSFVLRDSAFYEIKEVYKNQRTVDNERVLRGLTRGSDSLHQQMVDQQYKGN